MSTKFEDLFSHSMNRYAFGGVQVRDYVKIKDTNIEGISEEMKKELDKISKEDLNIKVLEIVKSTPEDGKNAQSVFSAVIGQEIAGGLFPRKFTVPVNKLKVVGFNVPESIPDSWKVDSKADQDGSPESAPSFSPLEEGIVDRMKTKKSQLGGAISGVGKKAKGYARKGLGSAVKFAGSREIGQAIKNTGDSDIADGRISATLAKYNSYVSNAVKNIKNDLQKLNMPLLDEEAFSKDLASVIENHLDMNGLDMEKAPPN